MPIRLPRTSQPQDPRPFQAGGGVVPIVSVGNPAAAAVRPAQQAASLAAQIYQEQRDREIVTRVSEIDMQRRQADGAVISSYQQAFGKNAVEQRAAAMAAIAENSRASRAGIQDREVASLWARQDAALTLAAQNELDSHYRQQNTKWQADTQESRASLLVNDLGRVALGDGYDPATGRLSVEAERTRSAYLDSIGELGSVLGWSPEQVAVARRKADTQAFGQVAESLIGQQRFEEAARVLERHGDSIDVGTRDQLAAKAAVGHARSSIADWSTRTEMSMQDRRLPTAARYAEADQLFREGKATADQRDALIERIDLRSRMESQQSAAATLGAMAQAESFLTRNPMAGVSDIPSEVYQQIEAAGKLGPLMQFARQGRYTTDPKALGEALSLNDETLRVISPQQLEERFSGRLDPSDMETVRAMQARAIGAAKKDQIQLLTIEDRVREAAAEVHGIPRRGELDDAEAAKLYEFRSKVQQRIDVEQKAGKVLGEEGLQKILDAAKLDVVSVSVDWGSDSRVATIALSPDQLPNTYVMVGNEQVDLSSIPQQERTQIVQDLRSRRQAVTEQAVAEMWVAGGRQDAVGAERAAAYRADQAAKLATAAAASTPEAMQAAEAARVQGIRALFPPDASMVKAEERRMAQTAAAAEAKRAAAEAQKAAAQAEAERVRKIRQIWDAQAPSGGR